MTTKAHNPYELDTEVDLGVDTQADTALPDEIGLSLQDSMTEKSSLPFVLQFPQSQDVRKKINTTKSSDNSSCHYWTGDVINEQDQERFYASFSKNGEEYTLDESVLVTSPNKKLPTIGQIHCLWEDKKTGKRIVELKVYYRPEETKEGRKPFQAPKELLDSNYFAQFTIDQVTKKCSVESYEKFRRRRDFPDDVYYFQDFYDYREQQTVEETPADNFSFRRRIVNIALNSKSPVKAKEQLKTSSKAPVNTVPKTSNTVKNTATIEKPSRRESQQSTQKQNSKGSEPEIDEDATIKLTMPPVEDDEFDFAVIEELAGITNNNSVAKHSTNIQEASTLITTQRDVERKKSPSMSDDETTSGGSDKRSKVSPKKTPKASESSSSNSRTTLSAQPSTTRASRSSKKGNNSLLTTDDSEDAIMKELEIEEEEETQAKPRSRITRQASTMDQSVSSHSKSNSKLIKAQTPKKKQAKDDSDEEFADPEEEKPKPKTRGRPKKQPVKKHESEDEESAHEEPVSEEEERPKPKKTRTQAKKAEPKKKPQPKVDSVEPSDEEETAILEALERETEELDTKTNSAKKRKLRAYTDNDDEDQSDGEKSGPSSPTKVPQTRARGRSTKSAETPRKGSTKSAFEFEGSEEKSEEEESPRKKRANRRLSVNSNDSKARDKKPAKVEVEEDVENEDSISDSEEKKKWTSPRKNKGPASKREKIKEMLQNYPKLSEVENNDPFDDYDKANDVFEAATEPIVVDVEKFNGRTMKQALATEDNDFELDNFLKDTPRNKRQKQLSPLVTKNDFGSRLGSLSNRMKYYQNWDIAETKEVIEVDDDSQDNRKNSNNSIGSYSSRPKNKSAQMKLDFAPVTEKVSSVASLSRSNNSNSGTPVRKSPYFSSNQQSTPPAANKVKVKAEHDPFISSILSKYDDDDEVQEKDKEIIDLSTQRPVSQVVTKPSKPLVQALDDDDDFKPEPKQNMEEFDDFDVESMLREVGEMGGDESEPKDNVPVIAVDDSSLDGHKSTVSKTSSRKKVDTSPSSDNNSESSTTRDSKKRKRGSDERKQRTLGTLNIIGAPEPNLLAEPPKKKRRLSEHIDRVKSKLRYGLDDDEVFMDKEEEEEEMDDELRDFIVDDNVELSQYESQALPIDDLGEEEGDEDSARDEAASQSSVRALADKLVKEGETKFLSTTFKMSDAFKIFIQYLVSCTLDPHFASEVERKQDDYFRPAVRKIHDDLFSKKEVIIRSSAWNATFKTNLDRLPVFRSYKMSHPEGECDACKRSMHTASWQIVLEGVSYDANSYWKDGPTNTNPNPHREPEQYTYNLGRFCHKRTELFHRLHHYKIRLNEQITERMNQLPSSLSENEVIDTILDDQLWINRLWKQFQVLRDDALKFGTKGSEDGHD